MTRLVVDIGGTYMRLAVSEDGQNFTDDPQKIKVKQFANVMDALLHFVQRIKYNPDDITHVLIAKSGRNSWDIQAEDIAHIFRNAHFILANDFEANAIGIVWNDTVDLMHLGGSEISANSQNTRAVIGSGTGLGLAYISPDGFIQKTHGGHMIPALMTSEQIELFKDLQQFKPDKTVPIYEDALSGNGILNIYKILSQRHHLDCEYTDTNHLISTGRNNPMVQQALKYYHEIFGLFAHQVLAFGASYGGLYLTGGITDQLIGHDLFDKNLFFENLYQNNVPTVSRDVRSTPVFWIKDEFISLKGLLHHSVKAKK